jgi:hypothetical protein
MDSCQALKRKIKLYEVSDKPFLTENIDLAVAESAPPIQIYLIDFSLGLPSPSGMDIQKFHTKLRKSPERDVFVYGKKMFPFRGDNNS